MNHYLELEELINRDELNSFIEYLENLEDSDSIKQVFEKLIKSDFHYKWFEIFAEKFKKDIDIKFIAVNINYLIKKLNINKVIKINTIFTDEINIYLGSKVCNKIYQYLQDIQYCVNKVFINNIDFDKVLDLLNKLKPYDEIIIKYCLELICYKYSIENDLDPNLILKKSYKKFNFFEYY